MTANTAGHQRKANAGLGLGVSRHRDGRHIGEPPKDRLASEPGPAFGPPSVPAARRPVATPAPTRPLEPGKVPAGQGPFVSAVSSSVSPCGHGPPRPSASVHLSALHLGGRTARRPSPPRGARAFFGTGVPGVPLAGVVLWRVWGGGGLLEELFAGPRGDCGVMGLPALTALGRWAAWEMLQGGGRRRWEPPEEGVGLGRWERWSGAGFVSVLLWEVAGGKLGPGATASVRWHRFGRLDPPGYATALARLGPVSGRVAP